MNVLFLKIRSQLWWYKPVVKILWKLRQNVWDFEASLGYGSKILSQKTKQDKNNNPLIINTNAQCVKYIIFIKKSWKR